MLLPFPRQPLVQILATDPKNLCRLGLIAFGGGQSLANVVSFHLSQCGPAMLSILLRRSHSYALWQIVRSHFRTFANDHRALNDVSQLANVAGKIVSRQNSSRVARQFLCRPAMLRRVRARESLTQQIEILAPVA